MVQALPTVYDLQQYHENTTSDVNTLSMHDPAEILLNLLIDSDYPSLYKKQLETYF